MVQTLQLNNYLRRIGIHKNPRPDLASLKELYLKHIQNIPFENIDPLVELSVDLSLEALQNKMIDHKRGGYCFEQNTLFAAVLKEIGFEVTTLAGRVLLDAPQSSITAKTHMLLLVKIDREAYIVDVGFGGLSPTGPILLETDIRQHTPHQDYRLIQKETYYVLQVWVKNKWKPLYRFTLQRHYAIDYKVANWYTATHPDSHFKNTLTIAKAGNGCRYAMTHHRFSIYYLNGNTETHKFNGFEEVIDFSYRYFGIRVPSKNNFIKALKGLDDQQ